MQQAGLILEKFEIPHEIRVMSSSRNPDLVDEYARTAFERGLKRRVCSTGMSGHLAAAVAARTILPVIGVPIASSTQMVGNEALRHRADAERRAGRDGRRRRGHERRGAGGRDRRDRRPRRAGAALAVQGRPGGGPEALIPRYSLPRDGRRLVRRGPARDTGSRSRSSPSRRGPSSGWSPSRTRARSASAPRSPWRRSPRSSASPATTSPRSCRWSRPPSGRRAAGCTSG